MKFSHAIFQLIYALVLLVATTFFSHYFFATLSSTGVAMLYLLVVVGVAYYCFLSVALFTAIAAFATINYFFVAPRYTFQVANVESWASLISFLIVAVVVTSLVKKLKSQTELSQTASKRAQFAQKLAEHLALSNHTSALLNEACSLLKDEFNQTFNIVIADDNTYSNNFGVDEKALEWAAANGKSIGPTTDNWPESPYWLIPFSRLPSNQPIMVVALNNLQMQSNHANVNSSEIYNAIKSCVDQIAQAYQRIISNERTKIAERNAQEEAIQSALLASISHDMRTPLTSILGAATALQQHDITQQNNETAQLTALISSQARHLANTTENILSLVRLESNATNQRSAIPMDWQSPEELIGVVIALFKIRGDAVKIHTHIAEPELLIKANAHLMTQALVNLIDNAKEANIDSQLIDISAHKDNTLIHISVKDYGAGFDEKFSAENIKKFTSTRAKGFGLGLPIVQAIARAHDATLTITRRDDQINNKPSGACVTLSFKALDYQNVD